MLLITVIVCLLLGTGLYCVTNQNAVFCFIKPGYRLLIFMSHAARRVSVYFWVNTRLINY
jgi:hypothetical protein